MAAVGWRVLIAHLPAGYLVSRALSRRWILFGLAGSVFPDIDLLWFYLVDHRQHMHHSYWTHIPIFWAFIGALCELFALGWPARLFVGNALVHLVLDTVQGGIAWAYPFSDERFVFVRVPALHGHWL